MANRKKRKDLYQASVRAKIGGLDVVSVDREKDYWINAKGAKVYNDASKHLMLEIPQLSSSSDQGVVYNVLSVGFTGQSPIATVKIGDIPQVFRLPDWYSDWVRSLMALSMHHTKLLPHSIEFGFYISENRYYAELV